MNRRVLLRGTAGVAVAGLAAAGMTACGSDSSSASSSGGGNYTVGVSWSALQTPYFAGLKSGLDAAAKKTGGIKLIQVQANNDANQQLNQLSQLQSQNVDLIVVNPADASTIVGGIKAAAASGIPIVTLDRMVPAAGNSVVTHVGASAEQAGYDEAQEVCKARGKTAKYLGIWGLPGNQTTRDRVAGVKRGATDKGCNLQLVAEKYETGETTEAAATTTAAWLQKYGPGSVDAIITYADSQAAGSLQELKSQKRTDIVVTGAANFGPFHDAICAGNKQALATVDFNVTGQGETLLATIEKLRAKQTVPKWVQTKEVVVTPVNRATCTG
jgi:ABC-type sugar transport system substrate-binding protein